MRRILTALEAAARPEELNLSGFRLYALKGKQKGTWSIWLSGNWRVTFEFRDADVDRVDYVDYH